MDKSAKVLMAETVAPTSDRMFIEIRYKSLYIGWLVVEGLTALLDSISVYIGPSPREREKEKRSDRREKKCQNNPHPHLLQAQQALALL